jgi:hypothetical protein
MTRRTKLIGAIASFSLFAGCSSEPPSDGPTSSTEELPLGAAEDYVHVPGAKVHRSCVHEIADGDGVSAEGRIVRADGQTEALAKCTFRALPTANPDAPVPAITGWVEEARWQTGSTVGSMAADWTVPAGPSRNDGQTIFLFPSLQHTFANPAIIIQPVLQWGPSAAGGGAWWGAASWVGPIGGVYIHGPLLATAPGESIRGVMSGSSCGTGHCATWSTNTYNQSRGTRSNVMYYNNPYGLWYVSGGVLEVANWSQCGDMPSSYTALSNVHVRNTAGTLLSPPWQDAVYRSMCGDYVWHDTTDVHLHY